MHGFNSIMLKDENGEPAPVYSVASGLDYPSSGPEHAYLRDVGRINMTLSRIKRRSMLSLRSLGWKESFRRSRAPRVAYGIRLANQMGHGSVLINLSAGDKDMDYIIEHYGIR